MIKKAIAFQIKILGALSVGDGRKLFKASAAKKGLSPTAFPRSLSEKL